MRIDLLLRTRFLASRMTKKLIDNMFNLLLVFIFFITSSHALATDNVIKASTPTAKRFTILVDSPYSFEETVKRVQEAILSNDFRVFPDRYLEQGLTDEFSVNERQMVIRFCHFGKLYKALQVESRLGIVLPCKITVLENTEGKVQLTYIDAQALAKLFDNKKLSETAMEIQENYSDILDEVVL